MERTQGLKSSATVRRRGAQQLVRLGVLVLAMTVLPGATGFLSCGGLGLTEDDPQAGAGAQDEDVDSALKEIAESEEAKEINRWLPVFVSGGSYDFNGDGQDDVRVSVDGDLRDMYTLKGDQVVGRMVYQAGELKEYYFDDNSDGVIDRKGFFSHTADGYREVFLFDGDGDSLFESRTTYTIVEGSNLKSRIEETLDVEAMRTSGQESYSVVDTSSYEVSSDMKESSDGDGNAGCFFSKFAEDDGSPLASEVKSLRAANVFDFGVLVGDKREVDYTQNSPRIIQWQCRREKEAPKILKAAVFVASTSLKCLDRIRIDWSNMIRMTLALYTIRVDCSEYCAVARVIKQPGLPPPTTIPENGSSQHAPLNMLEGRIAINHNDIQDQSELVDTLTHEMIHLASRLGHMDREHGFRGYNTKDGKTREEDEGFGTDEIYACGSFCGGCHVRNPFLKTHTNSTDGEVLADECSRCASPSNRWLCGTKRTYDVPLSNQLDGKRMTSPGAPQECAAVDAYNKSVIGLIGGSPGVALPSFDKTCSDSPPTEEGYAQCTSADFFVVTSCDDRFLPAPGTSTNNTLREIACVDGCPRGLLPLGLPNYNSASCRADMVSGFDSFSRCTGEDFVWDICQP